jgi:hypothetical protein
VHNLFTPVIVELQKAFESPLIEPSSIREKYLEALRKHAAPDRCTFCLGVHAIKGEWYYTQLEQALEQALEEVSAASTFRECLLSDHLPVTFSRHQSYPLRHTIFQAPGSVR